MGRRLTPRIVRSGPYDPSQPLTGDSNDSILLKNNLLTIGQSGRYYEQAYSGEGNLSENLNMVALTGTLTLTEGSTTVTGSGSLLFSEAHLGQVICAITADNSNSWELRPKQIISDTEMVVWKAPDASASGVTGWRMPRLNADEVSRQTCLTGNGLGLDKGHYIGAGSGVVRTNGSPFSASWSLARTPSLNVFAPATETYTNFPLGMGQPAPPALAAVGGGTKDMQAGNYSLVVCRGRTATGGYNNPSLRADVTLATGDKVEMTLGAMDTSVGQTEWPVFVTPFQATLGADLRYLEGPWFYYTTITSDDVSPAGGTFEIEWYDTEVIVNELVSFNNDPPTDAEWIAGLNNIPVLISCQGQGGSTNPTQTSPGPFICPAKPTNVEAFPLELSFSTSPPETILGVLAAQGRLYLLTFNHLQIAQATPDQTVPILIRPYWKDGFAGPDQLVFVNGNLYGYPAAGPSRSVGEGDEIEAERGWAAKVARITQTWNFGHVSVGYDPFRDMVVFIHSSDRRNAAGFWCSRMLGFSISQNIWNFDRLVTDDEQDSIVSGVATVADHMELLIGGRGGDEPLPVLVESALSLPPLTWTAEGTVTP